ncbi:hypothetical protein K440DRAFT_624615, partial [Wilcoxina mikolae CBS 423.85]
LCSHPALLHPARLDYLQPVRPSACPKFTCLPAPSAPPSVLGRNANRRADDYKPGNHRQSHRRNSAPAQLDSITFCQLVSIISSQPVTIASSQSVSINSNQPVSIFYSPHA